MRPSGAYGLAGLLEAARQAPPALGPRRPLRSGRCRQTIPPSGPSPLPRLRIVRAPSVPWPLPAAAPARRPVTGPAPARPLPSTTAAAPTAGRPAKRWASETVAPPTRAATGLRSMARVSNPSRIASVGIAPPPQNGSMIRGNPSPAEAAMHRCASASKAPVTASLPPAEFLDQPQQPPTLGLLRSLGGIQVRPARRVVHQRGEQHSPRHAQRLARPPEVHRGRMTLLRHRLFGPPSGIHHLKRKRHLDQLAPRRAQSFRIHKRRSTREPRRAAGRSDRAAGARFPAGARRRVSPARVSPPAGDRCRERYKAPPIFRLRGEQRSLGGTGDLPARGGARRGGGGRWGARAGLVRRWWTSRHGRWGQPPGTVATTTTVAAAAPGGADDDDHRRAGARAVE